MHEAPPLCFGDKNRTHLLLCRVQTIKEGAKFAWHTATNTSLCLIDYMVFYVVMPYARNYNLTTKLTFPELIHIENSQCPSSTIPVDIKSLKMSLICIVSTQATSEI